LSVPAHIHGHYEDVIAATIHTLPKNIDDERGIQKDYQWKMAEMNTDATVGFGIVGTGVVADFHRRAIKANADKGARLIAVSTRDPAKYQATGMAFGVDCISFEELCRDPRIDIVCICTPSGYHADQAIAVAETGRHALVEKPMALTLDDADRMIEAFSRAGRLLGVALQRRAEPLFRTIFDAIRTGDLGVLTSGIVTIPYYRPQCYFDSQAWRGTWAWDGGGVLMNQGIHLVDLLVWYMGDPVEIKAFGATLRKRIEVEDTVAAALRFPGGAMATVTATTVAPPGFPHRLEIYGTQGGIQVEGEAVTRWSLVDAAAAVKAPPVLQVMCGAGAGGDPKAIPISGHIGLVSNFMDAIRGKEPLFIDAKEGRRSLAAVLGVYSAAELIR
jgi:UDP-N-acetyl-2-amino-2-deoxyglucuronate dehydrogenase